MLLLRRAQQIMLNLYDEDCRLNLLAQFDLNWIENMILKCSASLFPVYSPKTTSPLFSPTICHIKWFLWLHLWSNIPTIFTRLGVILSDFRVNSLLSSFSYLPSLFKYGTVPNSGGWTFILCTLLAAFLLITSFHGNKGYGNFRSLGRV